MEQYKLPTRPLANEGAIVQGPKYRFTVLFDGLIRYEWAPDGQFEDRPSIFAINRRFEVPEFEVLETDDVLEIVTKRFHLTFTKSLNSFSPNSLTVQVRGAIATWGTIWRYGVKDSFHGNLGGTARTLDGANGAIPLEEGVLSRRGYAEISDSNSMLLESNGWVSPRRPGEGRSDGYVFAYGLDFRAAIKAYYSVSGSQPSLPRWALGNWWSRYHAYTADEYTQLVDDFYRENIPLSVGVIDMDWHLVNSPEVIESGATGWTGYTWNKNLFPDPPKFLKDLHDKYNIKVTLNDHPADGVYSYEDAYEEMAKALNHDTSHGIPIQFDPTSPEFFKASLQILHRKREKEGVDFWWIDWQQGTYSRIPGTDPLWLLNHFHYIDNKLYPPPFCPSSALRPIIFSRFAGPGSHRYPVGFSGDTVTTWQSLEFQPYFTLTASNIGFGWWSHDIGGHMQGGRDDELVARWIQLGCMSPVLRLHSTDNQWMGKEPWGYGSEARNVIYTWLRFRHRLLPYIGSFNFAMTQGDGLGWPLVQPMYWDYPSNDSAYKCKNQFFFGGTNLIVAPITSPVSHKTKLAKVNAWIPPAATKGEKPSKWVDIITSVVYDSNSEIILYRPLSQYPVLAKEGSIIPLDKSETPTNGCENPSGFEILVVIGQDGAFEILEEEADDQEALVAESEPRALRSIPIKWAQASSTFSIGPSKGSSSSTLSSRREFSVRFIGVTSVKPSSITVKYADKSIANVGIAVQKATANLTPKKTHPLFTGDATIVTLPPLPFPLKSTINISLCPASAATAATGSSLPHRTPSTSSRHGNSAPTPPPPRTYTAEPPSSPSTETLASSIKSIPPPPPPSTHGHARAPAPLPSVQIDHSTPLPAIFAYLQGSQLNFDLKAQIWTIVTDEKKSAARKLMDIRFVHGGEAEDSEEKEDVLGPVAELLGSSGL